MFTVASLNDFLEVGSSIARGTVEEYMLLMDQVLDKAFRREIYQKLEDCKNLCFSEEEPEIEQKIYSVLDGVMMDYSTTTDLPQFKDVVDQYWAEIEQR